MNVLISPTMLEPSYTTVFNNQPQGPFKTGFQVPVLLKFVESLVIWRGINSFCAMLLLKNIGMA